MNNSPDIDSQQIPHNTSHMQHQPHATLEAWQAKTETVGCNALVAPSIGVFTARPDYYLSKIAKYFCNIEHRGFTTETPGEFLVAPEILTKQLLKPLPERPTKK